MTLRRKNTAPTSPAILLARAIGGVDIVNPDATPRVKYRDRPRDRAVMVETKAEPCCVVDLLDLIYTDDDMPMVLLLVGPCEGETEADHAGSRGLGRKAEDSTCLPMCVKHHREPGLGFLLHGWLERGALRSAKNTLIRRRQAKRAA